MAELKKKQTLRPLSKRGLLHAICLGHGRALRDLRKFGPRGMTKDIERLLTGNNEYDPQCSGGVRDWYTHALACATDPSGKVLRRILSHLTSQTSYWERRHLQALAAIEARHGKPWAYQLLLDAMRAWPVGVSTPEHLEVVELGGIPVLVEWLDRVGNTDPDRLDRWMFTWAINAAAKRGGGVRRVRGSLIRAAKRNAYVRGSITRAVAHDPALARAFRDIVGTPVLATADTPAPLPRTPETPEESRQFVFDWLLQNGPSTLYSMVRKQAALLTQQDSDRLTALLAQLVRNPSFNVLPWRGVLDAMPSPTRFKPLLKLSRHDDRRVRCAANRLLGRVDDPAVRRHALRMLKDRPEVATSGALSALRSSFRAGDESGVMAACKRMRCEHFVHGIGLDLLALVEAKPGASWSEALLWIYEHTRCGVCRENAVELLVQRGEATRELLKEALLDGCDGARKAARKAMKVTRAV